MNYLWSEIMITKTAYTILGILVYLFVALLLKVSPIPKAPQ